MAKTKTRKPSANGHKPTSGKEWRRPREEGYLMTLPSGRVATLRPVELSALMMQGEIPDLLSPLAAKTLWLGSDNELLGADDEKKFAKIAKVAPEMLKLYNIVARAAFVTPRIVTHSDELADDEITLEDVEAGDKASVYVWVTNGVSALEFFRNQQSGNVETLPDGENVRPAAEPVDANPPELA